MTQSSIILVEIGRLEPPTLIILHLATFKVGGVLNKNMPDIIKHSIGRDEWTLDLTNPTLYLTMFDINLGDNTGCGSSSLILPLNIVRTDVHTYFV